jgi:hypothetical protein
VLSDPLESAFDVAAEVYVDNASLFVRECEEIAEGLGALQHGEPVGLTRNRNVLGCIRREHSEDAGVRSTFMELTCGMQVPRPISERGRHSETVAYSTPERLQRLVAHRRALKVGQQGEVIRRLHLSNKGLEEITHGTGMPALQRQLSLIAIDGHTIGLKEEMLLADGALTLPCAQQVSGVLFALVYVRLIEGIDA